MKHIIKDFRAAAVEGGAERQATKLSDTYTKKIGEVVFHVSALSHHAANQTAPEIILKMLENKVLLENSE
ncbi:MAG: hypothetical protein SPL71_00685 [Oribacterium sp.]|jgi:hypothetical protein|nr:hypothetical protein [Oribacterium sp.]